MKNIICPVSTRRIDQNIVRFTALWVVMLTGMFILFPNPYLAVFLVMDFFFRGFTSSANSPLSWFSSLIVRSFRMQTIQIDKAPKIFAARIGFLFSFAMLILVITGNPMPASVTGVVLASFAFMECGLNFCAGCWVYTYIVYPIYKDK